MKFNKLGRTGIEVSEICLGTMTWGRQNTEAEAHAQIEYALDQGINFIDTAELYAVPPNASTYGLTETMIGNWFARTGGRDRFVLASKVAGPGNAWIRGGAPITAQSLREALEGSLRRLQTDHIDLYQIHWPNRGHYHFEKSWTYAPHTKPREEAVPSILEILETLDALVREGKIRHVGLSNETAWGIMQFLRIAEDNDLPRVVSVQNEYNLLRRYFDHDLAEIAHYEDVGLLAYSPLASGALSGKYLDGAIPAGSRGEITNGLYRQNEFTDPAIRAYITLAKDYGLDPCQMALAFCLTRPFMTSVIVGATTMEQLRMDIGAADVILSEDVLRDIEAIFRRFPRTL